ncbi:hypothetical protein OIE62_33765 [Streptomyces scopuliridis]|uniref:Uncharacterized protein n=1 Tax=Streptomyces scopuliridis TaxID=452529 RepID=A0ACD4ZG52_9ACTN|nr:hypothetical protein [Streptomyces scopuliridis]WSB32555.1 hypothetical protein OG949_06575 [Streptomyces scopuliridis]WSB96801.1 hypothetical protein OG835_07170 [Streptomyces scopuliridis]WSC09495.1 hypothetical protein OIE62_33765 [Streptomyces scopuliridis]
MLEGPAPGRDTAETAEEPADGAEFETFAHLDRLLGLDLIHGIGRAYVPSGARGG